MGQRPLLVGVLLVGCLLVSPNTTLAQVAASSGFAGVVRDTSGAVLPGVTVEASSPVLIEKVRTAVTDSSGQYKLVELRTGIYTVTFTLTGFSTFKREAIELPSNFTATINAELAVGAMEETITVSGASPVVDVQNTAPRTLFTRETLDAIPNNRSSIGIYQMTPSMTLSSATGTQARIADVGGNSGEVSPRPQPTVHGSSDSIKWFMDGFEINGAVGNRYYVPYDLATQELSVDLGLGTAEKEVAGAMLNYIPKEGSNRFIGQLLGNYANQAMQASNVDDNLRARGLDENSINRVKRIFDLGGTFGGPIKQDKLWFFTSQRHWGSSNYFANTFYSKDPNAFQFTQDLNRQAIQEYLDTYSHARFTWQATEKDRFRFSYDFQRRCDCNIYLGAQILAPEATQRYIFRPDRFFLATWSRPATNKVLFEAGTEIAAHTLYRSPQPEVQAGPPLAVDISGPISILELSNNTRYRSFNEYQILADRIYTSRFSMSYVSGSHNFKVGMNVRQVFYDLDFYHLGALNYTFQNGRPVQLTQYADPIRFRQRMNPNLGIYVQDQWTIRRLTINAGLRFDQVRAYINANEVPAGTFVPARSFPRVDCAPCWRDLTPRLSASFDLFGTGKTALKAAFGEYISGDGLSQAINVDPMNQSVTAVNRVWLDANSNFVPDCVLTSPLANGECGAMSDNRFGQPRAVIPQFSKELLDGFGVRPHIRQGSASIQHEVLPGVAVNIGYFWSSQFNYTTVDNLAIGPEDFNPFCITAPSDPRLPGGGGNQLCGYYNQTPASFGRSNPLTTLADPFGKQTRIYKGVDALFDARFGRGMFLTGGLSTGRTSTNNCFTVDSPQQAMDTLTCNVVPPFRPDFKMQGAIPLPYQMQVSAALQNVAGLPIVASYAATNAEVLASLGRPLTGGASVVIPNLFNPELIYEARMTQIDVRFSKRINVGRMRIDGRFDVFNVFNANTILGQNTRYSRVNNAWRRPTSILPGRQAKVEALLSF